MAAAGGRQRGPNRSIPNNRTLEIKRGAEFRAGHAPDIALSRLAAEMAYAGKCCRKL